MVGTDLYTLLNYTVQILITVPEDDTMLLNLKYVVVVVRIKFPPQPLLLNPVHHQTE